jgi:hypothetical protein
MAKRIETIPISLEKFGLKLLELYVYAGKVYNKLDLVSKM